MLVTHWPLFDLGITTPRLELRYPSDDDLGDLATLAREPVHDADFMPFSSPWTRAPSPRREQDALRYWWGLRTSTGVDGWTLPFVVLDAGEPVGVQDLAGTSFPVTKRVMTGSWLAQRHQGRGIGKEMRAAVLHLAFAGFDALEAHTSAFVDNPASLGVTRALGYRENGSTIDDREGDPVRHLRFVMDRADWGRQRRDDVAIEGLDGARAFLGIA